MARYLQKIAELLTPEVDRIITTALPPSTPDAQKCELASSLGRLINNAVRCCPRGVQHTVRSNIVSGAVSKYCTVHMTEETDDASDRSYHKIHITPRKEVRS